DDVDRRITRRIEHRDLRGGLRGQRVVEPSGHEHDAALEELLLQPGRWGGHRSSALTRAYIAPFGIHQSSALVSHVEDASMARRRLWLWLPLGLGAVLVTVMLVAVIALFAFPDLVRLATVKRLEAITGRPVAIKTLKIDLLTGRVTLRGLRITDVDGAPLATLDRLDAPLRLRELLHGHISLMSLFIDGSSARVVRYSQGDFNISDLLPKKSGGSRALDVTVSDFALTRGTVVLEDRMLAPARTWRSEHLTIHAR